MDELITGTQCDLCYEQTSNLTKPASLLDCVEGLEWMCYPCNDRLSAALTEGRKEVRVFLDKLLVAEAEAIRKEHRQ
jgi:hypothetical protein